MSTGSGPAARLFNVIYAGEIHPDFARSQVRAGIARRFRITDEQTLDRVFSGKPCVLRANVSEARAQGYVNEMAALGAIASIRSVAARESDNGPSSPSIAEVAELPVPPVPEKPVARPLRKQGAFDALAERTFSGLRGLNMGSIDDAMLKTSILFPPPKKARKPVETPEVELSLAPVDSAELPASAAPAARRERAEGRTAVTRQPPVGVKSAPVGQVSREPETGGLCWGGFFAPWLWATFNGYSYAAVLMVTVYLLRDVVPYWSALFLGLHVPSALYLLFRGRQKAWDRLAWSSATHFNQVQRRWTVAGMVFFLGMAASLGTNLYISMRMDPYMAWEDRGLRREAALLRFEESMDHARSESPDSSARKPDSGAP